jgi:hypothetical protein
MGLALRFLLLSRMRGRVRGGVVALSYNVVLAVASLMPLSAAQAPGFHLGRHRQHDRHHRLPGRHQLVQSACRRAAGCCRTVGHFRCHGIEFGRKWLRFTEFMDLQRGLAILRDQR